MHASLIVLDSLDEWSPFYDTQSIITAQDYLQNEYLSNQSHLVINLCNDLSYNSEGYYCSLLAKARGHKIIPSVETLNKISSEALIRLEKTMQKDCFQFIKKNGLKNLWQIDIYFGTCKEDGLEKVARYIFEQFHCPILRVTFNTNERNQIESIKQLKISELSDNQQDYFAEALDNFSKKVWREPRSKKPYRYDLAILHDPEEQFPPSDKRALNRFVDIAKKMNINAELITAEDSNRLMEFDALFIRQTTEINHVTYQMALKAAQADLVVIDDPVSIIRCTNKVYLKELLDKEQVVTPKSTLLFHSSNNSFEEIASQLGLPIVVKIPDGSFSHGVKKVKDKEEFHATLEVLFKQSAILLAQEYIPTEFDWRIGIINKEPIFACKYFMAKGHWQIYNHKSSGKSSSGNYETVPIYQVPKQVIRTAVKATSLIGKGLYGVDLKQINDKCYIIEINDNPNIDFGVEDAILGDELYGRILPRICDKTGAKTLAMIQIADIKIRKAKSSDLNEIYFLEQKCFKEDAFSKRQFSYLIKKAKGEFVIVRNKGRLIAYLIFLRRKNSKKYRIYSIAISSESRGQGIAKKLLDYAEKKAIKNNAQEIALEVSEKNSSATSLYIKQGYQIIGNKPGYYSDGSTALIMTKEI